MIKFAFAFAFKWIILFYEICIQRMRISLGFVTSIVTINRRNDDKRSWTCTRRDLVEKNMNLSKKDVPCIVVQTPLDDSAISHVWTQRQLLAIRISIQVTWLVIAEIHMYSTFRHNPHTLGYLCAKFRFCGAIHCRASLQRKLAHSITHSSNLFDLPGTKAYR